MTCTYDGHLVCNRQAKTIEPCCPGMHEYVIDGIVYLSSGKDVQIALRRKDANKRGRPIMCCPFCGAKVEASP